jgi:hypothetical protein
MAIKDPTAAVFRPQSGSNLIIVGQMDEPALAIVATSIIGLAAQYAAESEASSAARFYILDGTPIDNAHAGLLSRLRDVLPHPYRTGGWRDLGAVVGDVAAEVERRVEAHEYDAPAIYLVIHGLQRFRDLRPEEEDFGFGRRGEERPPSPAKLFGTVLRDGPGVGVHTIIWCDSLNNVSRALDRQALREFEMRVLFQMSAADSSNLIDNPLASKLGVHRALYHSEDRGQPEKFRPYALPSEAWLSWVKEQFEKRKKSLPVQAGSAEQAAS